MSNSTVRLRGIAALVGAMIVATPLSAQAQCGNGISCKHPIASTKVGTAYRYKTVQRVSNVNRYRNVTRTSYNDITRTKYRMYARSNTGTSPGRTMCGISTAS